MSDQKQPTPFAQKVRATFDGRESVRPEEIANALGISGKNVRGFLRANFTRPAEQKGSTWTLDATTTNATLDHFLAKRTDAANANEPNAK